MGDPRREPHGDAHLEPLLIAGSLFFGSDAPNLDSIEGAHAAFGDLVSPGAALAFALALLASFVNRPVTTAAASVVAGLIIALNAFLLFQTFFG